MTNELLTQYLQSGKSVLVKRVEIASDVTNSHVLFCVWHFVDKRDADGNLAHDNHLVTIVKSLHNENVGPGSASNHVFDICMTNNEMYWMSAYDANKRLIALVTNHMLM